MTVSIKAGTKILGVSGVMRGSPLRALLVYYFRFFFFYNLLTFMLLDSTPRKDHCPLLPLLPVGTSLLVIHYHNER